MRGHATKNSVLLSQVGGSVKVLQAYRRSRKFLKQKFPGDWKRSRSMDEWVDDIVDKTLVP